MAAPNEIVDLVERLDSNLASYKSGHYNETQVRREFVYLFFMFLAKDMDNEQGFSEAFGTHSESTPWMDSTTKAFAFIFRISGNEKFLMSRSSNSRDLANRGDDCDE